MRKVTLGLACLLLAACASDVAPVGGSTASLSTTDDYIIDYTPGTDIGAVVAAAGATLVASYD